MIDRFSCIFLSFIFFNIFTLQSGFSCHSPYTNINFIIFRFSWIFKLFILSFSRSVCGFSLSMQMFGLHSPIMGFHILVTLTLQPGFRFSLSKHIFGLHSPSRCWIFLFFNLNFFFVFHTLTVQPGLRFSLSMQVFSLHSPITCWLFLFFFKKSFFMKFHIISYFFLWVFILSLSNQNFGSHSPCRCLVYTLQSHIVFLMIFRKKQQFHTLTLQPGSKNKSEKITI